MNGITSDMVQPISDSIKANLSAVMPIGILVFGVIAGLAVLRVIISHVMNG